MEEKIEKLNIVSSTSIPEFGNEEGLEGASQEETEGAIIDE